MIEQIYIDNYRCFVNFEWKPQQFNLLLGENGGGKSTILSLFRSMRDLLHGGDGTSSLFAPDSLTEWDSRQQQTFEFKISDKDGIYDYRLVVDHVRERKLNRIDRETLRFDGTMLYEYKDHEACLYRDDGSEGPRFPVDWSRSAIATIPERHDNKRLTWFRNYWERMLVVAPDPLRMSAESDKEEALPNYRLTNAASWLRYVLQENFDIPKQLQAALQDAIMGFGRLHFEQVSQNAKVLKVGFRFPQSSPGTNAIETSLPFSLLSDGQRGLVALYLLLFAGVRDSNVICIDEPDNYVALRELQPWLIALKDKVEDSGSQCFLISHHPELLNYLAPDCGQVFYRDPGGVSRSKRFDLDMHNALTPAEAVARGWGWV